MNGPLVILPSLLGSAAAAFERIFEGPADSELRKYADGCLIVIATVLSSIFLTPLTSVAVPAATSSAPSIRVK